MPRAIPRPTCYGCCEGPPAKGSRFCVVCQNERVKYAVVLLGVGLVLVCAAGWHLWHGDLWGAGVFVVGLVVWGLFGWALPAEGWMREVGR